MDTGKIGLLIFSAVGLGLAISTLDGQTQSGTPQSGGSVSSNASPVHPQRQGKQEQRQQQKQQQQTPSVRSYSLPSSAQATADRSVPGYSVPSQGQRRQVEQQGGPVVEQQSPQTLSLTPEQQKQERRQRSQARKSQRAHPVPASVMSYSTAQKKCVHERHPHVWWTEHYAVIVFSVGGYYYYDAGYWFPAFGYNPNYEAYDYDGPIYTYGNLLPDQVILNVQRALTELGYYGGPLTGSLGAATREAIAAYQQDNDLAVNGIVDAPLIYSLGLQ